MSEISEIIDLNINNAALSFSGALSFIVGFSVILPTIKKYAKERGKFLIGLGVGGFLVIAGLVCFILGISLNSTKREKLGENTEALVQQLKEQESLKNNINERMIISIVGALFVILGLILLFKQLKEQQCYGFIGLIFYTLGWIAIGISSSSKNQQITSIQPIRLYFIIPCVLSLVISTYFTQYCAALPISMFSVSTLGIAFGNSLITRRY